MLEQKDNQEKKDDIKVIVLKEPKDIIKVHEKLFNIFGE